MYHIVVTITLVLPRVFLSMFRFVSLTFLLCLSLTGYVFGASIELFGALPEPSNVTTDEYNKICFMNAKAITAAFLHANSSTDNVVLVEGGKRYCYTGVELSYLYNVVFQIDGVLLLNDDMAFWKSTVFEEVTQGGSFHFFETHGLSIIGSGTVEGQGYNWWVQTILSGKDRRVDMFNLYRCTNLYINGPTFKNSPQFHFNLKDMRDIHIKNVTIFVDVNSQTKLFQENGKLDLKGLPTFPLNV